MRYLGIDYGRVRMGVALSDEEGRIAFPLAVLKNRGRNILIRDLKKIMRKEGVGRVVVGLPRMLDGRETEETERVKAFVRALGKEITAPIVFEDERLTTRLAEHEGIGRKHIDSSAAAIILQSYLDKKNQESWTKS